MALKPEYKRYILLMFALGVVPTLWVFINGTDYFKAGLIYMAIGMVLLVIYFNGGKL